MAELPASVTANSGFQPTDEDVRSVAAWFEEYDTHARNGDVERMADMALFPLNVVSDNEGGDGSAAQWTREQFVATMSHVVGDGGGTRMESERTPVFLTGQLVLVITNATFTTGEHVQPVRYADLLVKKGGRWLFQTMVQGGWGDQLGG
jgi:ketosteroid isomerase-like protein